MLAVMMKNRSAGFTLIELIVTIAIAAVLAALAAPSFIQYQRNSELTSLTNSLLAAVNAAKGEAMKTGRNAFVIPRGSGWNSGWIVYVDMNRDNSYTEGTDITVQTQDALKGYFSITGNSIAAGASPYVKFDNSGYSVDTSAAAAPVALSLTIARTDVPSTSALEETRRVVVARTGRGRTCQPSTDRTGTSSATQ